MSSDAERLKTQLKKVRDDMSDQHVIRLHRALSWFKCAEEQEENPDLQFINL